jgi:RNA polymerase sigma-70 factor, ECF subfamily
MERETTSDQPIDSILVGQIPYLRRYARGLTRNAADADDLVQSCLMRALTNMHRFEKDTNLRAWLLTILHNMFIDTVRKHRRAREAFEAAGIAADGVTQGANQFHHIQVIELEQAIAGLPSEQRSTLLLVALEDLTYEEAAKVTGVPVGTVRSRLSRARHTLMRVFDGMNLEDILKQSKHGKMHERRHVARASTVTRNRAAAAIHHHRMVA